MFTILLTLPKQFFYRMKSQRKYFVLFSSDSFVAVFVYGLPTIKIIP